VGAEVGSTKRAPAPRRLGDAWLGWDERRHGLASEFRDGPAIYLALHTLLSLTLAGAAWLLLWLAQPRLAAAGIDPAASRAVGLAVAALLLLPAAALWGGLLGLRFGGFAGRALLRAAIAAYPAAAVLGRRLRLSPDRLGHSFLDLANRLARRERPRGRAGLLLLAPRCLSAHSMRSLRGLAAEAGCEFAVVGGGEEARALIGELDPAGVLAVACERDLVAGVREFAGARPVLALANRRPEGPCRNSEVDAEAARERLERLRGLAGVPAPAPYREEPRDRAGGG